MAKHVVEDGTVQIAAWHNLARKGYEAIQVTPGRPIPRVASEADRQKSRRFIALAKTRDEAVTALSQHLGVPVENMVDVTKTTKAIYAGKRRTTAVADAA